MVGRQRKKLAVYRIRENSASAPRVHELVGLNSFRENVSTRVAGSCCIISGLSDVVANIYYVLKISDNTDLYGYLNQDLLFRKILTRVNSTRQRNCWLAVSPFMKVFISCQSRDTFRVLTRESVQHAMARMFRRSSGQR